MHPEQKGGQMGNEGRENGEWTMENKRSSWWIFEDAVEGLSKQECCLMEI